MEVQLDTKACAACGQIKPRTEFYVARGRHISYCKPCDNRKRRDRSGSKPRAPRLPREEVLRRKAEYSRRWFRENKERHAEYKKIRARRPDIALRNRLSKALRRTMMGAKQRRSTFDLLGFTADELKAHIERQFLRGMSWENMSEWHIDHIVPLCEFELSDPNSDDFKRAWALSNLRPLWAKENCSKNGKRIFLI